MLTARCDEVSITLGYKLGADFYMAKSFEIDFLQTIICNILINREKKRNKYLTFAPITPPQESTISKGDEVFMTKLNKIINDNLAGEELSIKFLTDAMAMSRASLYNKVKLLTGLGVNDYINRLRIEKSVYLLTHTDLGINEISYEVGFSYPRYFSTSFKQIKGITPTRFKEENKKNT